MSNLRAAVAVRVCVYGFDVGSVLVMLLMLCHEQVHIRFRVLYLMYQLMIAIYYGHMRTYVRTLYVNEKVNRLRDGLFSLHRREPFVVIPFLVILKSLPFVTVT